MTNCCEKYFVLWYNRQNGYYTTLDKLGRYHKCYQVFQS